VRKEKEIKKKDKFSVYSSSFQLIVTRYKLQDNLVSWLTGYPVSQLRKSKNKTKRKVHVLIGQLVNCCIGELVNWLIYLYLNLNWSIGRAAEQGRII